MGYYYATIDENNICKGISDLNGEVNLPNMLKLNEYDASLLGKKYNKGLWEEVEVPLTLEPVLESLTKIDQDILDTAINTDYLV